MRTASAEERYEQALTAYRAGLAMREGLRAIGRAPRSSLGLGYPSNSKWRYPSNSEWQSLIAESHSAIGDTMLEDGNDAGALESYRESLAIAKRLAADHPGDPRWQAKLGTSFIEIASALPDEQHGEKLKTYRAGVKALQKATDAKPDDTQWRRDLSYGYGYLGRELVAANEYEAALDAAQKGIELFGVSSKAIQTMRIGKSFPTLSLERPETHLLRRSGGQVG